VKSDLGKSPVDEFFDALNRIEVADGRLIGGFDVSGRRKLFTARDFRLLWSVVLHFAEYADAPELNKFIDILRPPATDDYRGFISVLGPVNYGFKCVDMSDFDDIIKALAIADVSKLRFGNAQELVEQILLSVSPFIEPDRRIRLQLHPERLLQHDAALAVVTENRRRTEEYGNSMAEELFLVTAEQQRCKSDLEVMMERYVSNILPNLLEGEIPMKARTICVCKHLLRFSSIGSRRLAHRFLVPLTLIFIAILYI
jgi:hypothetical protein